MTLALWLHRAAATFAERPALLHGTKVVADYAAFGRLACGAADRLTRHGVRVGDRVALYAENDPYYLVDLFAIWWLGAVAVPINAKLHPAEAAWIVKHSDANLVLASETLGPSLASALVDGGFHAPCLERVQPEESPVSQPAPRLQSELAWIFYTSGTTGRPKGAMLSHGNLTAMSLAYLADVDDVTPDDCAVYAAPLSHGAGLYSLVHVLRGARHCVPQSGGFLGEEVLSLASALRAVSLFAAPTMVRRMVDAARRTGSSGDGLKTVIYGGGPMYQADLAEAMATLGPCFAQIYGQGETPMTITVLSKTDHGRPETPGPKINSVGRPHCVVDVRVTAAGVPVPPGVAGEIEVRGATVMLGYWNDPQATAAALQDGWLRTGDIGVLDSDGYLRLTDRSKDVIISGGTNIYPREVEEVLLTHPAVREASVVGLPDPEWGEVVVAAIVAEGDGAAVERELDALCCASIARFKRPKRYVRLDELPKNNYGKILKSDLRRRLS